MDKISIIQFNNIVSSSKRFEYYIVPHDNDMKLVVYKNRFMRLFNMQKKEYIIDFSTNNNLMFGDDRSIDFYSYTKYCEKGFNENPMEDDMLDLLNAASGVAEEANELMGVVRKFVFHSKPFSLADFASEAGDLTWNLSNLLRLVNVQFSDVLRANKVKLDFRYPDGRSKNYKLNNRDKAREKELIHTLLEESGAFDTYNKNKIVKNHA